MNKKAMLNNIDTLLKLHKCDRRLPLLFLANGGSFNKYASDGGNTDRFHSFHSCGFSWLKALEGESFWSSINNSILKSAPPSFGCMEVLSTRVGERYER